MKQSCLGSFVKLISIVHIVPKMLLCSRSRGSLLGFLSLLLAMSFCYCEPERVEVVGMVECTDCKQMNIVNSQVFSGLRVTVDCKFRGEESKVWGMGHPNGRGKFKVSLPPPKIVASYLKMKEELDCTASVQNAFGTTCPPVQNQVQLKSFKIIFFNDKGKIFTLGQLAGTLKISLMTCGLKSFKLFTPPSAQFYKSTLLSQAAAHTVYIPRPPSFPTLYPPLSQPAPDLEPMTPPLPPPVPNLEPISPPLPPPISNLEPTSPPPVPHLEPTTPVTPPLPPPVPHLEPTTPPTSVNPFPPPNPIPAQSPPFPAPISEKPDPFPPVGESLPPPAPMSNELPPPPILAETLKPPTNGRPLSPTSYEPSLPPR